MRLQPRIPGQPLCTLGGDIECSRASLPFFVSLKLSWFAQALEHCSDKFLDISWESLACLGSEAYDAQPRGRRKRRRWSGPSLARGVGCAWKGSVLALGECWQFVPEFLKVAEITPVICESVVPHV